MPLSRAPRAGGFRQNNNKNNDDYDNSTNKSRANVSPGSSSSRGGSGQRHRSHPEPRGGGSHWMPAASCQPGLGRSSRGTGDIGEKGDTRGGWGHQGMGSAWRGHMAGGTVGAGRDTWQGEDTGAGDTRGVTPVREGTPGGGRSGGQSGDRGGDTGGEEGSPLPRAAACCPLLAAPAKATPH